MDGSSGYAPSSLQETSNVPGASFGAARLPARPLDPGMGLAVARRTVFRPEDAEDFGAVADRVAAGNIGLRPGGADPLEELRLRNAIASGALLTSGRHLQHGDAAQPGRNLELFTNCATAISSFASFYLLLNGAGVGRSYEDALMAVDWAAAPTLLLHLPAEHADFPQGEAGARRFAAEMGIAAEELPGFLEAELLGDLAAAPADAVVHRIADSREGWAKALELFEAMAFRGERDRTLVLDLSEIRPAGAPIAGMQGRPASGPVALLRSLIALRREVIAPAREGGLERWEQALLVDHHLSVAVQVGGARRAARMATKPWRDPGALRFIRLKAEGGLWTANNSVMVDREFWSLLDTDPAEPLAAHAQAVFAEATRCGFVNGEPGFINADLLEDHRTGNAWTRPVYEDGRDFRSRRYQADAAAPLLAELARRASQCRYPVTTNPCGEIALHVAGGYCVIADFAPLLACPVPFEQVLPGAPDRAVASLWDARVEDAVRLGVRFLVRANRMDALYGEEVRRTDRIGIGPTGLHEYAWMRFGLDFHDILDEAKAAPFWAMLDHLSAVAKQEATDYAASLGQRAPITVTTVKPSGTISKLFGLTEGAHLPARRQYLRWVQFRGVREPDGTWSVGADPLLADYERRGYPLRTLRSFPGMSIVGFPTVPLIMQLGLGDRLVTAPEASPAEQFHWLRLLERHWIGTDRGNQVSYTLKLYTDRHDLESFRAIVQQEQPRIRACAILPSRPDDQLGYEYLPEEEVSPERFAGVVLGIEGAAAEAVDLATLQCASGVCPI